MKCLLNVAKTNPGPFSFPQNRYEIYAHIAEARSLALGRQPDVAGPFDTAAQVDLDATFDFGGGDYTSHSAQFLSTNMIRSGYWRQLLQSMGIGV